MNLEARSDARDGTGPVIGVTTYARDGSPPSFALPCAYVDAVRAAGGVPVLLPPTTVNPEAAVRMIDGLVLAGGGDIAPEFYGGSAHESIYMVSEERDRSEFALVRFLLEERLRPLLCICRGLQVLNVVCGGSLVSHVPDAFGDRVCHRLPPREPTRHGVRLAGDSRLARWFGATETEICSWHHQAIDRPGDGLRAVAWAEDGVVEALEHECHPWCIAVQWHPELQYREVHQRRLFGAFVDAAAGTASERGERR